jgi:predicted acyltransferase
MAETLNVIEGQAAQVQTTGDAGAQPTTTKMISSRLVSIDAYRGFVMLMMMAGVLDLPGIARSIPQSHFWEFVGHHQTHVPWVGCSLYDLIQPSFAFMVGVAAMFSIASRIRKGQTGSQIIGHAVIRAIVLIFLGIYLRSLGRDTTIWVFDDTVTLIGIGYVFLVLFARRPARDQWIAFGALLVVYWLAFALYPLPRAGFDTTTVGVPKDWPHLLTGFAAHWNKNTNLGWAFDKWFVNLFPHQQPFLYEEGGWITLSFVPNLATMILGLIAGSVVRGGRSDWGKVKWFATAGVIGIASGWLIGELGICPVVKRLWTPSFVLFSSGWCFLFLAAFYAVIEVRGYKRWAFPLVVLGMNSITAYVLSEAYSEAAAETLKRHFGQDTFKVFGAVYEPLFLGVCVLIVFWLILYWMYRREIFLRI